MAAASAVGDGAMKVFRFAGSAREEVAQMNELLRLIGFANAQADGRYVRTHPH